jgi:hypothetical protein
MDPVLVLIAILAIVGPAILFVIKLVLFTAAAAVVANAISPTVVVRKDKDHGKD